MRIINFSADGIENAMKNGFFDWLKQQDADIICIQDVHTQEFKLTDTAYFPEGYYHYFLDHPDHINGVAIFTKTLPKAIMYGLGFEQCDTQARYIQADFEHISVGSIIIPHAEKDDQQAIADKALFLEQVYAHMEKILNKRRQYIFTGNWQIAHQKRDTQQVLANDQPGFLPSERAWLDAVFTRLGYVDAFRQSNKDSDEFTWWPMQNEEDGRRVDFQIISQALKDKVEFAAIYKGQRFASHAPVIIDYDLYLEDASF